MSEISTVAELDALPEKTVVLDCVGDAWQKAEDGSGDDGRWHGALPDGTTYSANILLAWKPFTVIYRPHAGVTRSMTRCSGSDACVNTTPLPPGASWSCGEHTTNTTTGGES